MKKAMIHLLDLSTMSLQVHDDRKITHGVRHHEVVIQVEQKQEYVRFLLENQYRATREWFTTSREEWQRLHCAPDWRNVSWSPFITYERATSRGKATLTRREDPLLRKQRDMLSSEFWQARVYLTEGILTTFTEFSCLAGRDDAFCNASEWTVQIEQEKYNPAYTFSALIKKQPKVFRVIKGFAHIKSIWIECSEREIIHMIMQYNQLEGHTTILVRDIQTLKALLPNIKVAGEHSSTGLPLH